MGTVDAPGRDEMTVERPIYANRGLVSVVVALAVIASMASGIFASLHARSTSGRLALMFVVLPVLAVVAGLIVDRRPRNLVGWVFLAVSALIAGEYLAGDHAIWALEVGAAYRSQLSATFAHVIGQFTWILLHLGIALFPTGNFASRAWRRTFIYLWAVLLMAAGLAALAPGPLPGLHGEALPMANLVGVPALDGVSPLAVQVVPWMGVAGLVLAAASLITRFWSADESERRQIALVVYAMLVYVVAEVVEAGVGLPANVISGFAAAGVPIAVGVALLRHQLYGIDHLISRTISYGALTLVLGSMYMGAVIGVGQHVLGWTGTARNDLLVAIATLGAAAAFGPLRRHIQTTVDRRFNRVRYDAANATEALARELRHEFDLDAGVAAIMNAARRTLHPAVISLWLAGSPEVHAQQARSHGGR